MELALIIVAGGGSTVVSIDKVNTVDVGIKEMFPTNPSHITRHELVLNDVGT